MVGMSWASSSWGDRAGRLECWGPCLACGLGCVDFEQGHLGFLRQVLGVVFKALMLQAVLLPGGLGALADRFRVVAS